MAKKNIPSTGTFQQKVGRYAIMEGQVTVMEGAKKGEKVLCRRLKNKRAFPMVQDSYNRPKPQIIFNL
jgi:hypothetical protein